MIHSTRKRLMACAAPLLLLATVPCAAHPGEAAAPPPAAATPALWKVADADTTIYLFGTVHILPAGIEWQSGPVGDALARADVLVTEIPVGPEADAMMQQIVAEKGTLPPGASLRSLLDAEQLATFDAAVARLNLAAGAFDHHKPWMAGLMMTILPLLQQGYTLDAGVEESLLALAGPDKPRAALETIAFQLGLFDGMDQAAQIEFLLAASSSVDQVKPMLDAMVAEWAEGDADGLAAIMNAELGDPAVAETLLYARNRTWADWIGARMDQPGTVFMAVGAGHLAGAGSVQDVLRQRGIVAARVQ